ncbi:MULTISPECIES: hypothetical protein [Streptomyces]|uniref:Uncharacterized protein n=1 Tax=Streptomyces rochei TaxID=1928 RepID=A0AAX3ZSG6_STRRO|nr:MULTISPECIES: hypothetical protein [Streptomyces]WDI21394.1 hypothetical protein PS783_28975 [Streptomyces enissocaesilis]MBQ0881596.1 hypothetical protein [Streptomyces sp. RT42]MDI3098266.1 hypothetical protein [Streptomyces sp. AN-3]WMC89343.1 hypothetical protein P7W03_28740 [Streptomyces rochei]WMI56568.1 hypothetical protein RBH85_07075 [Streptomyces rochei]
MTDVDVGRGVVSCRLRAVPGEAAVACACPGAPSRALSTSTYESSTPAPKTITVAITF